MAKRWKKSDGCEPCGQFGSTPCERLAVAAAVGDPLRHARERLAALVRELHVHERLVRVRVEGLLGVLDLLAVQLGVVLEHEEAVHARGLVRRGLALEDHDAARHLEDRGAGGRAAGTERLELCEALGALRVLLRRAAGGLVVGEQALAARRRVVIALDQRLAVRADRVAVGAEQVVAVGGRAVVLLVGLLRREVRARRHVGLLGLRLLLLRELRGVVERLRAGERHVRPVRVEHVRLPVVELELRRGAHLLDRALARSAPTGSPIEIWSRPERWISGSETPSASVRLRIVSSASSSACCVTTGTCGVGWPW